MTEDAGVEAVGPSFWRTSQGQVIKAVCFDITKHRPWPARTHAPRKISKVVDLPLLGAISYWQSPCKSNRNAWARVDRAKGRDSSTLADDWRRFDFMWVRRG